jgi:Family of unknown function (DUF5763)
MSYKNQTRPCKARTKDGRRCRAPAMEGGLCYFHANPAKAVELGRIGGRKHGLASNPPSSEPLPKLDNARALRDLGARLIADVHAGKLHPRVSAGLAPLLQFQLRAIQTSNTELRLARLERLLAESDLFKSEEEAGKKSEVTD